jgi:hypothetical protein
LTDDQDDKREYSIPNSEFFSEDEVKRNQDDAAHMDQIIRNSHADMEVDPEEEQEELEMANSISLKISTFANEVTADLWFPPKQAEGDYPLPDSKQIEAKVSNFLLRYSKDDLNSLKIIKNQWYKARSALFKLRLLKQEGKVPNSLRINNKSQLSKSIPGVVAYNNLWNTIISESELKLQNLLINYRTDELKFLSVKIKSFQNKLLHIGCGFVNDYFKRFILYWNIQDRSAANLANDSSNYSCLFENAARAFFLSRFQSMDDYGERKYIDSAQKKKTRLNQIQRKKEELEEKSQKTFQDIINQNDDKLEKVVSKLLSRIETLEKPSKYSKNKISNLKRGKGAHLTTKNKKPNAPNQESKSQKKKKNKQPKQKEKAKRKGQGQGNRNRLTK